MPFGAAASGVVVAGALPGMALPIAPDEGAAIPVPGAAIAPLAAGAMPLLDGAIALPGALIPLLGGLIPPLGGLIPPLGGLIPLPVGAMLPVPELEPLAGITPPLAFCRLCSFSFSTSASPVLFDIMECLPCIIM